MVIFVDPYKIQKLIKSKNSKSKIVDNMIIENPTPFFGQRIVAVDARASQPRFFHRGRAADSLVTPEKNLY